MPMAGGGAMRCKAGKVVFPVFTSFLILTAGVSGARAFSGNEALLSRAKLFIPKITNKIQGQKMSLRSYEASTDRRARQKARKHDGSQNRKIYLKRKQS